MNEEECTIELIHILSRLKLDDDVNINGYVKEIKQLMSPKPKKSKGPFNPPYIYPKCKLPYYFRKGHIGNEKCECPKEMLDKPKLSNTDIYKWLGEKKYQKEQGEQEYMMYFELDMPKILNDYHKFASTVKQPNAI